MTASDDAHEQPVTGEDVKDEIVVDTSSSAGDKRRNACEYFNKLYGPDTED